MDHSLRFFLLLIVLSQTLVTASGQYQDCKFISVLYWFLFFIYFIIIPLDLHVVIYANRGSVFFFLTKSYLSLKKKICLSLPLDLKKLVTYKKKSKKSFSPKIRLVRSSTWNYKIFLNMFSRENWHFLVITLQLSD